MKTAVGETEPTKWRPAGPLRLRHVALALACLIAAAWLHSYVEQRRLTALVRSWPPPSLQEVRALVIEQRGRPPGEERLIFVDRPSDIAEFRRAAFERPPRPTESHRDAQHYDGGEIYGLGRNRVKVTEMGWADPRGRRGPFFQVYRELPGMQARAFPLGRRWSQWLEHVQRSYPALRAMAADVPARWGASEASRLVSRLASRYGLDPSASFVSPSTGSGEGGATVRYAWLLFRQEPPRAQWDQFRRALAAEAAKTKAEE